jgi:hypothetical protein
VDLLKCYDLPNSVLDTILYKSHQNNMHMIAIFISGSKTVTYKQKKKMAGKRLMPAAVEHLNIHSC